MSDDLREMSKNTPGTVVADFPQIQLGRGEVEMGAAWHLGVPCLWFGRDGQGIGVTRERNDFAEDGETLAMVQIPDLHSLEVLEKTIRETRALVERYINETEDPQ